MQEPNLYNITGDTSGCALWEALSVELSSSYIFFSPFDPREFRVVSECLAITNSV